MRDADPWPRDYARTPLCEELMAYRALRGAMPLGWLDSQPESVRRTVVEFGRYCEELERRQLEAMCMALGTRGR